MLHSVKMTAAGDDSEVAPSISFDDFWKLYPRRVARKDAMKAWAQVPVIDRPDIIEALPYHKKTEDWRRDGGRYIPYPASWLRAERWKDELTVDLSMGECEFNRNGNRGNFPKCTAPATIEKHGIPYCSAHAARVN